jgi:hypothetical protein
MTTRSASFRTGVKEVVAMFAIDWVRKAQYARYLTEAVEVVEDDTREGTPCKPRQHFPSAGGE